MSFQEISTTRRALCDHVTVSLTARTVQKVRMMDATRAKVRILVIRPWTSPLAPIRKALREAGFDARLSRVDIEPALNAALSRRGYDVILFDPATKELSRATVEARLRDHHCSTPIVTLTSIDDLVRTMREALLTVFN